VKNHRQGRFGVGCVHKERVLQLEMKNSNKEKGDLRRLC
jgi:hypothetical protein